MEVSVNASRDARRRAIRTDWRISHFDHLKKESMREIAKIEKPVPYRKYSVEQVIAALGESHGMIAPAARSLGCSRDTIRRYLAEHAEIAQTIADEREATTDLAENKLRDAIIRGEAWAICFYLKCMAKDRGYVEKAELTGANGGPVKIEIVYD